MKRYLLFLLFALFDTTQLFSQETLQEFIIGEDNPPLILEFFKEYGCKPDDGVIVFNTTIPDLKFTIPNAPNRLSRVSSFDNVNKRYVLCVQPTDGIGGYTKYVVLINGKNFKPEAISVGTIKSGLAQYFKINPKIDTMAEIEKLKKEIAELKDKQSQPQQSSTNTNRPTSTISETRVVDTRTSASSTLPKLSTNAVRNFAVTTAILGGNIINAGMPEYTERGVCYSTTQNPTTANNKIAISGTGTESFITPVTSLKANTTYYVRAYAINSVGTAYGAQVSFKTYTSGTQADSRTSASSTLPRITTNAVTIFSISTAILGGNIINTGTPAYTERGVVYAISQNPTIANNKIVISGTGTGSFITPVTNLTTNTTYYVRAYAINSAGTAYGRQVSFKTSASGTQVNSKI